MQNNQASTKAILLRPRPIQDESWYGYLARVTEVNGFYSVLLLPKIYSSRVELQEALLLSNNEIQRLKGPVPEPYKTAQYVEKLFTYNLTYLRWCPKCVGLNSHHKSIWSLRFSCVCVDHGLRLHDKCPQCYELQHLKRNRLFQCEYCGADLKKAKHIKVDECTVGLQLQIINSFIGVTSQSSFNLSFQDLNKLVLYIGQFNNTDMPTKPGKFTGMSKLDYVLPLLKTTAQILDNWPTLIYQLMHKIQVHSPVKLSIKRHFGSLYYVLYAKLKGPQFDFLRDAFENYLNQSWPSLITQRNRAFKSTTISEHPRFTIKQISDLSGVEPSVINHIANTKKIKVDVVKLPSGRQVRLFHKDFIQKLKSSIYQTKTLQQTAMMLQLSEDRVRYLIEAEMLTLLISKTPNPAKWLIQESSIEKLCFFSVVIESGCVSLKQILKNWKLCTEEFLEFTRALIKHELTVYSETGGVVAIGNAWLKKDVLKSWLDLYREENNTFFSVDETAKLLGLKQQVVYHLVDIGLIESEKNGYAGKKISKEQLSIFDTKYVSLSKLAKSQNTSPIALIKTLKVKPVTGPKVDGGRQYFYLRKQLGWLKAMKGNSNETQID